MKHSTVMKLYVTLNEVLVGMSDKTTCKIHMNFCWMMGLKTYNIRWCHFIPSSMNTCGERCIITKLNKNKIQIVNNSFHISLEVRFNTETNK